MNWKSLFKSKKGMFKYRKQNFPLFLYVGWIEIVVKLILALSSSNLAFEYGYFIAYKEFMKFHTIINKKKRIPYIKPSKFELDPLSLQKLASYSIKTSLKYVCSSIKQS